MPSLCLFGAQWGDEGKGKIIDGLAPDFDVVVRYQGGANAGHTVVAGGEKYVLHLIPSGVLHEGKRNVIAGGVAVDPFQLLDEIRELRERGVSIEPANLRVSARAHLILDHHKGFDLLAEKLRGEAKIGTTGRGIGPAYADKASRSGLRMGDLLDAARFESRLTPALVEKNEIRAALGGEAPLDVKAQLDRYSALRDELAPFVCDTGAEVRDAYANGERVLFEAAQGAMLDLDHGTYPFVTSSSTAVNGIPAGVGFPARHLDRAWGIAKAYCTRVGEGPFPTEQHGEVGERIRELGHEYGATTGRPRRCGWLDAVALGYALEWNGADGLVLTNLDVLSGFGRIGVGVAYRIDGRRVERFPAEMASLDGVEVEVTELEGWNEDITGARTFEELPAAARAYVEWLEKRLGVPLVMLSVGPGREQVIDRMAR